jgi:phosphate starvation-inducible protein PhoH
MAETPTYFDASFYMITDESQVKRKIQMKEFYTHQGFEGLHRRKRRKWI